MGPERGLLPAAPIGQVDAGRLGVAGAWLPLDAMPGDRHGLDIPDGMGIDIVTGR